MNEYVYLLQHSSRIDGCLETKIIGIYSTEKEANSIVIAYKNIDGFKKYENDFFIDKYRLNQSFWGSGFSKIIID